MAIVPYLRYDLIIDGIWAYDSEFYKTLDKNKNYYEVFDDEINLFVFGIVENQDNNCITLEDITKVFPNFKHENSFNFNNDFYRFKQLLNLTEEEIFYICLKYDYIKYFLIFEEN